MRLGFERLLQGTAKQKTAPVSSSRERVPVARALLFETRRLRREAVPDGASIVGCGPRWGPQPLAGDVSFGNDSQLAERFVFLRTRRLRRGAVPEGASVVGCGPRWGPQPLAGDVPFGNDSQLVERFVFSNEALTTWGCSSVGRAPRSQRGGRRFDPVHLHHVCLGSRDFRGAKPALKKRALFLADVGKASEWLRVPPGEWAAQGLRVRVSARGLQPRVRLETIDL